MKKITLKDETTSRWYEGEGRAPNPLVKSQVRPPGLPLDMTVIRVIPVAAHGSKGYFHLLLTPRYCIRIPDTCSGILILQYPGTIRSRFAMPSVSVAISVAVSVAIAGDVSKVEQPPNISVPSNMSDWTRIEIAPSVWMPRLTMNAYPNTAGWLAAGGRGMDCALDYGDTRQRELGAAVTGSKLPRSELFVTTKVPCCPKGPFGPSGWPFLPVTNCSSVRNTTADIEHDLDVLGLGSVFYCVTLQPNRSLDQCW